MDALGDRPTVLRSERKRLQDEEVERALRKVETLIHGFPLVLLQEDTSRHVEVQEESFLSGARARGRKRRTARKRLSTCEPLISEKSGRRDLNPRSPEPHRPSPRNYIA